MDRVGSLVDVSSPWSEDECCWCGCMTGLESDKLPALAPPVLRGGGGRGGTFDDDDWGVESRDCRLVDIVELDSER